jgi:uncharacterized damage-inducible protein DinB
MTLDDLKTLLDFHYWALDRVFTAAARLTPEQFTRDMGSSFKSVRDTLAHLYSAEWAWYQRWHGTSPTAMLPFDQFPDVRALRDTWSSHESNMRAFMDTLTEADITRVIEYRTLTGAAGSSPIWQMVQHVVNHGSYHRGQLTTMFRQLGVEPGKSMDLIGYYREQAAKAPK